MSADSSEDPRVSELKSLRIGTGIEPAKARKCHSLMMDLGLDKFELCERIETTLRAMVPTKEVLALMNAYALDIEGSEAVGKRREDFSAKHFVTTRAVQDWEDLAIEQLLLALTSSAEGGMSLANISIDYSAIDEAAVEISLLVRHRRVVRIETALTLFNLAEDTSFRLLLRDPFADAEAMNGIAPRIAESLKARPEDRALVVEVPADMDLVRLVVKTEFEGDHAHVKLSRFSSLENLHRGWGDTIDGTSCKNNAVRSVDSEGDSEVLHGWCEVSDIRPRFNRYYRAAWRYYAPEK